MILKANCNELENVSQVMDSDSEICKTEIDIIEEAIHELLEVWQGSAANRFGENSLNYIHRLKGIPESLGTMAKFVDKSNNIYRKTDEEYGKKLETEALNDDKREQQLYG